MADGRAQRIQSRWWIGTLHDPTEEHRSATWLPCERVQAYAGQIERCPTSGRLHLQFVVRLTKNTLFTTVKKWAPTAHWEVCRSPKDAWAYCQKEETRVEGPWVEGAPDLRSRRDERLLVATSALAGKSLAEVCDELDCSIYQVPQVKRAMDLLTEPYKGPLETIEFVYGPSGAGKSHYVRDLAKRLGHEVYWYIPQDGKFAAIAPYRGEGVLAFNEFQDAHLTKSFMAWLKCMLDDGGMRYIDYKNSASPLLCRHVVFVSQDVAPWDLSFPDVGARTAFLRRLSQFGKVIHAHSRTFTPIPLLTEAPWGPADGSPLPLHASGGGAEGPSSGSLYAR